MPRMEIRPYGRLSFQVRSHSRGEIWHLVDLEEHSCSCERFTKHHLYAGKRCHHIAAAREWLLNKVIHDIKENMKENK